MSKLAVLSLLLVACATDATTFDRETAPRAKVRLDLSPHASTNAVFPKALDPTLPSVDRISRQVRARLGDVVVASLELCVSPAGHVTDVKLLGSSSFDAFDAAVLRDARTWQFAAIPGPDHVQSCERATLRYLTPR